MTDVRLKGHLSLEAVTMDWLLLPTGQLDEREELATAARVALGTDKLADVSEVLPDPDSTDRKGWWGDLDADLIWGGWPIGCKNWLLSRAKISDENSLEGATVARARQYTQEALKPFLDKRIATQMDVSAVRTDIQQIEVTAHIYRGPAQEIDLRYQLLWQETPVDDSIDQQAKPDNHKIRVPYVTLRLIGDPPKQLKIRFYPPTAELALSKNHPSVFRS